MTNTIISDFKAKLNNIKISRRTQLETAFLHWYVDTQFDTRYEKKVTDGPRDGGIDAVVFGDETVFVIQSEFCQDIFVEDKKISPLSTKKYAQFDGLYYIFLNEKTFNDFLKTVDGSLHDIYKKVVKKLVENPSKVVWQITTLHGRSKAGEKRLQNIDPANIKYASDNLRLYELSLEGATPPASPLELNFTEHFIVDDTELKIKSYVAQAFVRDFIEYMQADPEFRVLARNVRSEIKDKKAKEIKNEMVVTYKKHPLEFWYSHNGITILCDRASIKGKGIYLVSPYIINGAQTIHALRGISSRNPKAKILVRIIEIPSENLGIEQKEIKKFINSIIFRTNQQNRMYAYDLRANDKTQVELANDFISHRVFYERRRGDWGLNQRVYKNQGLSRLKSTELAQILMSSRSDLGGVSLAKKSSEDLFLERYYTKIFCSNFEEIFFKYKLFLFVKETINRMKYGTTKSRDRNHTILTIFSLVWSGLESSKNLKKWFTININTPCKFSLNTRFSKQLRKMIENIFIDSWKLWREENKKDETLSPNNFFKSSHWNKKLLNTLISRYRTKIQRNIDQLLI